MGSLSSKKPSAPVVIRWLGSTLCRQACGRPDGAAGEAESGSQWPGEVSRHPRQTVPPLAPPHLEVPRHLPNPRIHGLRAAAAAPRLVQQVPAAHRSQGADKAWQPFLGSGGQALPLVLGSHPGQAAIPSKQAHLMIVGSSLYSTPVMVLRRFTRVVKYFLTWVKKWYNGGSEGCAGRTTQGADHQRPPCPPLADLVAALGADEPIVGRLQAFLGIQRAAAGAGLAAGGGGAAPGAGAAAASQTRFTSGSAARIGEEGQQQASAPLLKLWHAVVPLPKVEEHRGELDAVSGRLCQHKVHSLSHALIKHACGASSGDVQARKRWEVGSTVRQEGVGLGSQARERKERQAPPHPTWRGLQHGAALVVAQEEPQHVQPSLLRVLEAPGERSGLIQGRVHHAPAVPACIEARGRACHWSRRSRRHIHHYRSIPWKWNSAHSSSTKRPSEIDTKPCTSCGGNGTVGGRIVGGGIVGGTGDGNLALLPAELHACVPESGWGAGRQPAAEPVPRLQAGAADRRSWPFGRRQGEPGTQRCELQPACSEAALLTAAAAGP